MDFGLWVEPEMVNPDSALYRAHSDWVLNRPGADRPTQRHQLVLDLTNPAAAEHIFAALDALLAANPIAYLKWDHNRDLRPAASAGAPAAHAQTLAYYRLLDRLRARHPGVEIESCASGGGRIDLEVLTRATRVWLSDNTDAIERLAMQTAASIFLPPEVMGSHVGSSPNPSTGRRLSMTLRARTALFAHMGVEADPARMTERERETLISQIALYKRHRDLIARGLFLSFPGPGAPFAWMSLAPDRREALALLARADFARHAETPPVRLPYLDPALRYRVRLEAPWPGAGRRGLSEPDFWRDGPVFTGEALGRIGLRLPLVHPETAWLLHLAAEG
jgi:alpha-galactosidase